MNKDPANKNFNNNESLEDEGIKSTILDIETKSVAIKQNLLLEITQYSQNAIPREAIGLLGGNEIRSKELLVTKVILVTEGSEYSVDLFVSNERIFAICQRIRVQTRQGISYVGEIVDNNKVRLLCDKLITRLNVEGWGVRGNLNIQVRGEPPKLLEVNPRLSGSCVMCTYAGVNFPEIAVHYAMGWDLPSNQHPRIGTRIYRHWDEEVEFPRE